MRRLINIISEGPEQVKNAIKNKVDAISSEEDLQDILKFTKRFGIKQDVRSFATLRNYRDIVADVLLQALASADIDEDQTKKFLSKLSKDGILNEKTLLTPRVIHSYLEIIDKDYQDIFNQIKVDLSERIAGKIGEKGDVGKGEYMLDIISKHVRRRGAPGDLDVGGTKVELKAGENGRLGPDGTQPLFGRFDREFVPFIKKLMPDKPVPNPLAMNILMDMSAFTDYFENAKNVRTALVYMIDMMWPTEKKGRSIANQVVDGSGNINTVDLKAQVISTAFEAYKSAKGFDGVIIMDKAVTRFLYIQSGEDAAAVAPFLSVVFPRWEDSQSNAVKFTLKAERKTPSSGTRSTGEKPKPVAAPNVVTGQPVSITPPGANRERPKRTSVGREKR